MSRVFQAALGMGEPAGRLRSKASLYTYQKAFLRDRTVSLVGISEPLADASGESNNKQTRTSRGAQ